MSWMHEMREYVSNLADRKVLAQVMATECAAKNILEDALASGAMRQDVTVVLVFRRCNDFSGNLKPELR